MSSIQTRSQKQKADITSEPSEKPEETDVLQANGTSIQTTEAGFQQQPQYPDSVLNSDTTIQTVVESRHDAALSINSPRSQKSNVSTARLQRLQEEYEASLQLAEFQRKREDAERRREEAEEKRLRELLDRKLKIAREMELLDEDRSVTESNLTAAHAGAAEKGVMPPERYASHETTAPALAPPPPTRVVPSASALAPPPAQVASSASRAVPVKSSASNGERRKNSSLEDKSQDPIERLAAVMEKVAERSVPHMRHRDLPRYNGDRTEWLAFVASYRETSVTYKYSKAENMARLRVALSGKAREQVNALLFTEGRDPEEVISTLERVFGRPSDLIDAVVKRILETPPLKDYSPSSLDDFAAKVRNCMYTVKSFNRTSYLDNPELISTILSRLTAIQKSKFADYAAQFEHSGQHQLELLSEFLCAEGDKVAKFLNIKTIPTNIGPQQQRSTPARQSQTQKRDQARTHDVTNRTVSCVNVTRNQTTSRPIVCTHCDKGHPTVECKAFKDLNVDERWEVIKKSRACFKCLKGKHSWNTCKARSCNVDGCRRPHHSLLHNSPVKSASESNENILSREASSSRENDRRSDDATVGSCRGEKEAIQIYFKVAPVVIQGPRGQENAFAFLDEGSAITMVEQDLADRIGLDGTKSMLDVYGVLNNMKGSTSSKSVSFKIRGRADGEWHELTNARTAKTITLEPQTIDATALDECEHLDDLREQLMYRDARPTVLIGHDNWHLITSLEVRIGKKNQLGASRTGLGWVAHGYRSGIAATVNLVRICHARTENREDLLDRIIQDGYALDALGILPRAPRIPNEERALKILKQTTKKTAITRYEVGLLWKKDKVEMPPSEHQALIRLKGVERKMAADTEYRRSYTDNMNKLISSGYAELCPPQSSNSPLWYLPHFGVKNPNKPNKLRIVFDAAAHIGGASLNDQLLSGPDLLQSLLGVLLRFREGAVAFTADIKEMFLRVGVREEDRDAQRFLWRDSPDKPPLHYRMRSLIFGATSSPCSALYVKNHNAHQSTDDDEVIEIIEKHHYMDDAIYSSDDIDRTAELVRKVTEVHAQGGFQLRGFASNEVKVLSHIPVNERSQDAVDLAPGNMNYEKTLGLYWQSTDDELSFNLNMHRVPRNVADGNKKPTKREALSLVMSVYDPLGILTPITTESRVILQQVWRCATGWDDEITDEIFGKWVDWLRKLNEIRNLRIPRHYGCALDTKAELHLFCDASSVAYAAVGYWRFPRLDETADTILIASKSKVAPLRPVSIPRLELQAALLGLRLADTLQKEHRVRATSVLFWSDSSTALKWIRSEARRYKPFVAHRVAEIQENTKPTQWRYVPTKLNPADLATRLPPQNFDDQHWWFSGPAFLRQPPSQWPEEFMPDTREDDRSSKDDITTNATDEEYVELRVTCGLTTEPQCNAALPDVQRFSSRLKLLRATARVLQFIGQRNGVPAKKTIATKQMIEQHKNLPKESRQLDLLPLPQDLIDRAENLWTSQAQRQSFPEDMNHLQKYGTIQKQSRLCEFTPILDDDGLVRATGRINAAKCADRDVRSPIILDARHLYVKLLIKEYHERFLHANHETVLNEIRQKFWILHLRTALRALANSCVWCKVRKAIPPSPPYGDLPSSRFSYRCRPFTACGVDYFGPIEVTIGRRREKRWGALFTCLTTRAVHVELASSLSADSMILALRRLAARRGTPTTMWSDNGTNFVGANRELAKAHDEIKKFAESATTEMKIRWHFIPPGTPHMGGSWERMVRSIKTALAAILRERSPKEEILHTLMTEAEHIVNSRPLTHVSAYYEDDEALTPNHFLIGTSSGAPTPCTTTDNNLVGRATWRTAQRLADMFWSRWVREYLPTLLPRGRARAMDADIKEGDVVLIVDPTLPRNTWPRGLVHILHPGPDGRVRVVEVKTKAGSLRRPVHRLVRLPTREEDVVAT